MIDKLLELKVITEKQAEKFKWAVFKRHHDTQYDTKEQLKEANKVSLASLFAPTPLVVVEFVKRTCFKI